MRRWWSRLLLLAIIGLTAFSGIVVWPSEPDRYLPDQIPWPEGRGIKMKLPTIEGGTFGLTTIERRAMSLGLDLRGGTRLVLAPADARIDDLDAALEGARRVVERRVNEFGVAESEVNRLGNDRLSVQLPGIDPEEAIDKIGRTALLQFCEPVTDAGGNVAVVRNGTVTYEGQTCEPQRDAQGNVVATAGAVEFLPWANDENDPSSNFIVWQPAKADLDGVETELTGRFLRPNTRVDRTVTPDNILGDPILNFEFNPDGADILESVTARLAPRQLPLAFFLDGEPIRGEDDAVIAPRVNQTLSAQGIITGLENDEAQDLSTLLNTGAFPVALVVVQQQDVDATLGDNAVRNTVIAGEVALLVIMLFMVLYYRLPGVMASLALVCYTSFALAIFKLVPVTLTLAGVGAFVLSLGMAVDANILIFERMKEELRVGRNLVVALEDGFNRAWSSIRDSNISSIMTALILYWFGNQFDESSIKGFALVWIIGVLISMFTAIIVTRTFMRFIIGVRPLARRLGLFAADLPDDVRRAGRPAPAVAGGAGGGPAKREER